jgi:hypothetical protein
MPIDSSVALDHFGTLRVRSADDLLQLVPYLVGFHPADSFVVVGLRDNRVLLTARCDLVDMADPARCALLVRALIRAEARDVLAIVYSDGPVQTAPLVLPHGTAVADFGDHADDMGRSFLDALLVSNGRWWSYCCTDDVCCPSQGQPVQRSAPSAVAAAATVAGMVALPDRATMAAQLDPLPRGEREAVQPALAQCENEAFEAVMAGHSERRARSLVRALFAASRRADAGELTLSETQLARFGVALSETEIRDSVWVAVDERRIDGRELWRSLARRLPEPYDATPLFLVGWIAWREGNGALASIAARRALSSDPQYTPADLLLAALAEAIDPRRLPRIRRGGISATERRRGR